MILIAFKSLLWRIIILVNAVIAIINGSVTGILLLAWKEATIPNTSAYINNKNKSLRFTVSTSIILKSSEAVAKIVAKAIINLSESTKYKETTFEIGGEFIYSFEELLKILLEIKNIKRILIPLNPKLMMIPAYFLQQLPKPPFTVDQMKLLKKDNILDNNLPGLKELGIKPTEMKKELVNIYG